MTGAYMKDAFADLDCLTPAETRRQASFIERLRPNLNFHVTGIDAESTHVEIVTPDGWIGRGGTPAGAFSDLVARYFGALEAAEILLGPAAK